MMTLKPKVGLATPVMRATMNEEYLKAKANLCLNQAEIDLQQQEIARAIKNLERANSALSRLFGLEGEAND
jgi:putative heme iron utilization protein